MEDGCVGGCVCACVGGCVSACVRACVGVCFRKQCKSAFVFLFSVSY